MPSACTVIICAPELLADLKQRVGVDGAELLTFSSAEPLGALEAIAKRRPGVVALERLFAATPRGAALINRIKADPKLSQSEIRVVAHDSNYMRVSPRKVVAPVQPLDQRGTRRAQRFKIAGHVGLRLDGHSATLVDLSTVGAQIISTVALKPSQRVRIELRDDQGGAAFDANVAWAHFEIQPHGGSRYRAGVDFVDADASSVDAYCARHKA